MSHQPVFVPCIDPQQLLCVCWVSHPCSCALSRYRVAVGSALIQGYWIWISCESYEGQTDLDHPQQRGLWFLFYFKSRVMNTTSKGEWHWIRKGQIFIKVGERGGHCSCKGFLFTTLWCVCSNLLFTCLCDVATYRAWASVKWHLDVLQSSVLQTQCPLPGPSPWNSLFPRQDPLLRSDWKCRTTMGC